MKLQVSLNRNLGSISQQEHVREPRQVRITLQVRKAAEAKAEYPIT